MYLASNNGVIAGSVRDLAPFQLLRPSSIAEAVSALADGETAPTIYAGGTDIVGRLREGENFEQLLWLKDLEALKTIAADDTELRIGALATLDATAVDPAVATVPGLPEALALLANVRIRFTATVGGNVMARHTAYEIIPILMALEGRLRFSAATGDFDVAAEDIWEHPGLDRALLTDVSIPLRGSPRLDYDRTLRPYLTQAVGVRGDAVEGVVATRLLRPHRFSGAVGDDAATTYATLPENYSDALLSNGYIRSTGAALLSRQRNRLLERT